MTEWFDGIDGGPEHVPQETLPETGFVENMQQSMAIALNEDLPVTSRLLMSETRESRVKRLIEYNKSGEIPDEVMDFYWSQPFGLDVDALSMYARDTLGLVDIPRQGDYEEAERQEYADERAVAQSVHDRATTMGTIGEFAGKAFAIPADPLYAASFFTGYGSASTAIKAAMRVAAIEAGVETVAQPFVYDWKEQIGSDYSGADALFNIIAASTLGGAMAGAGKALQNRITTKKAKKVLEDLGVSETPEGAPVYHVLRNSDPKESAAEVLARDEGIDITTNQRGPSITPDPGADDAFAKRQEVLEKNRAEARAAEQKLADEAKEGGVTQVTPKKTEAKVDRPTPPKEHSIPVVKQHLDFADQADEFLDACGAL